MSFTENLGVITCRCVMERDIPVRFVSHAGGDWQMYCHDSNHDFTDDESMHKEFVVVHVAHLLARDPSLEELSELPVDVGAERSEVGAPWVRFEDKDD